jgi:outer membrane protein TolC
MKIDQKRVMLKMAVSFISVIFWSTPIHAIEGTGKMAAVPADLEQRIVGQPSLADLVAYAYQGSPLIKAAKAEWRANIERYRVETSLDDPEVMLEGMYMTEAERDLANPNDWKVSLTQPLPLPGKLAKAGVVVSTEARIARLSLDSVVRDTTLRIRESYHELIYLREAKRLATANRDLLDQLRKVGETASSSSNRASLLDVMKAQAQAGQVGFDVLLLEESARTEQTRLNAILNRGPEAPVGTLVEESLQPVVFTLLEIYLLAETNLEEIRIAQANIDKSQALVDLSRYETLPRFALGVSYGDLNQQQQFGVQAGLSLPLWFDKNAGRMGAARAESEKMRAQWSAQVNESRVATRDVYFRLQNSERLNRLYRDDLIPQANRAMQTAETWYTQGQGSFSDYSETVGVWYNFQLALARSKADYGKFLARLESLTGRTLTERGAETQAPPEPAKEDK